INPRLPPSPQREVSVLRRHPLSFKLPTRATPGMNPSWGTNPSQQERPHSGAAAVAAAVPLPYPIASAICAALLAGGLGDAATAYRAATLLRAHAAAAAARDRLVRDRAADLVRKMYAAYLEAKRRARWDRCGFMMFSMYSDHDASPIEIKRWFDLDWDAVPTITSFWHCDAVPTIASTWHWEAVQMESTRAARPENGGRWGATAAAAAASTASAREERRTTGEDLLRLQLQLRAAERMRSRAQREECKARARFVARTGGGGGGGRGRGAMMMPAARAGRRM
ncbi:hypothetical protein DFJ73DRAFT_927004, partial [Zopfochytrium polystomum]